MYLLYIYKKILRHQLGFEFGSRLSHSMYIVQCMYNYNKCLYIQSLMLKVFCV